MQGKIALLGYATAWVEERPSLAPKTLVLYRGLVKNHIGPKLGDQHVGQITTPIVRRWRQQLLAAGVGVVTVAKAYRLLHTIMQTAMADRLIRVNPCQIPKAGKEESPERPIATLEQVFTIADAVPAHFRLLVLLGCFTSCRWGELAALTRKDIDADAGTIAIRRSASELPDGSVVYKVPKSAAGVRTVTIPAALLPDIEAHLADHVGSEREAPVFLGKKGGVLRRSNFQDHWRKAIAEAGMPELHFHDLRHTGNMLAADTGANLRELMERMGHASTRAALIYLHKKAGRDKAIADGLSAMIDKSRAEANKPEPAGATETESEEGDEEASGT